MHEERLRPVAAASGVDSVPLTVEAMQQRGNVHHVTFLMDAQDRWRPGGLPRKSKQDAQDRRKEDSYAVCAAKVCHVLQIWSID